MKANKVQTNDYGVNVLVETKTSNNHHISHLNREVEIVSVLSDEEIITEWQNRDKSNELEYAKDWIKKQKGFAISNCNDKESNIGYGTIVKFK